MEKLHIEVEKSQEWSNVLRLFLGILLPLFSSNKMMLWLLETKTAINLSATLLPVIINVSPLRANTSLDCHTTSYVI